MSFFPVNRVAGILNRMSHPDKIATETRKRISRHDPETLQENLRYELDRASMKPEDLLEALCEQQADPKYIKLTTIQRWLNGERKFIQKNYRKSIADLFGYSDPDSILRTDHRKRRENERQVAIPSDPEVGEFVGLLQSFGDSSRSNPEDDAKIALEILKRPRHGTYLSIAIHWLNRRSS